MKIDNYSALWPIARHETKKLLPMLIMLFLLMFNHCVLWNLKDSLVVTTSGAEVIPFVKVWAVLPSVVLLTYIYTKLTNRFSQEQVFYLITSAFLLFFALFAFVLYPYRDGLHPKESVVLLERLLPAGFKGLIALLSNWTNTLFYVLCELWNTMVITVLFWGFANQITLLSEAPRFYSLLSLVMNIAVFAAGLTTISISQNRWEQTMMLSILLIIVNGVIVMGVFRWMTRKVVACVEVQKEPQGKKIAFRESLQFVAKSKYLLYIAVIVVAYNVVINSVEVVWKDQLRKLYPAISDYNMYMSHLQVIQGIVAIVISLCMAKMMKSLGWIKTALVTPVLMLALCAIFFGSLSFGTTSLALAVMVGSIQNCMSKACKNSLFDATKEMAYIPLSDESKLKGKAAIDGIGARLGKSGASLIHQGLLLVFATLSASVAYIGILMLIALLLWILSIRGLGKHNIVNEREDFFRAQKYPL